SRSASCSAKCPPTSGPSAACPCPRAPRPPSATPADRHELGRQTHDMPGRLPRVNGTQVLRALQRAGWQRVTQVGSHVQLKHPTRGGRVTVPVHGAKTLKLGTLDKVLEQAGLSVNEFTDLL